MDSLLFAPAGFWPRDKEYLLPPWGFGPEAKTRGGTIESLGVYIQGQRIFVEKVRNVFLMGEKFSI